MSCLFPDKEGILCRIPYTCIVFMFQDEILREERSELRRENHRSMLWWSRCPSPSQSAFSFRSLGSQCLSSLASTTGYIILYSSTTSATQSSTTGLTRNFAKSTTTSGKRSAQNYPVFAKSWAQNPSILFTFFLKLNFIKLAGTCWFLPGNLHGWLQ